MDNIDWNNKIEVLKKVSRSGGWVLKYASDELINDKEFILTAVSVDGDAFKYTSDELKNDKEVILAAISNEAWALNYVSVESRSDYDIMKEFFILAIETYNNRSDNEFYPENELYNCILSKKLQDDLDNIKQIYNYDTYKQVCEYIKRTDEIKKYSYKLPLLDTKFRFI
jgi:hypothetical protein